MTSCFAAAAASESPRLGSEWWPGGYWFLRCVRGLYALYVCPCHYWIGTVFGIVNTAAGTTRFGEFPWPASTRIVIIVRPETVFVFFLSDARRTSQTRVDVVELSGSVKSYCPTVSLNRNASDSTGSSHIRFAKRIRFIRENRRSDTHYIVLLFLLLLDKIR